MDGLVDLERVVWRQKGDCRIDARVVEDFGRNLVESPCYSSRLLYFVMSDIALEFENLFLLCNGPFPPALSAALAFGCSDLRDAALRPTKRFFGALVTIDAS